MLIIIDYENREWSVLKMSAACVEVRAEGLATLAEAELVQGQLMEANGCRGCLSLPAAIECEAQGIIDCAGHPPRSLGWLMFGIKVLLEDEEAGWVRGEGQTIGTREQALVFDDKEKASVVSNAFARSWGQWAVDAGIVFTAALCTV